MTVIVDARGHRCPVPSLKLQKAMQGQPPGTILTLMATDPMARIDVPYLMNQQGGTVLAIEEIEGILHITVATPVVQRD
ncbi:sulfurtransferase TusA family protein [Brevundimonas variabilis]|uniref:tRNA 2-thiouridine synthesizing protein A n=1 Tax=Brevundimonas variabilis TaxID=74312 RepID=A0A7W9FFI6_9CAUL|nr:sulfurtransferase TusA family protein [Brevundimonas variabilis]MBB5745603.1 tRNA 2-thiouridine synthesizing protein A [Brevundimonas variabilis]